MTSHNHRANRPMKWKFFSLLPALLLAHAALATDPLYLNPNWASLNYVMSINPPPMIDGHNYMTPAFDNEGQFDVTFDLNVTFVEFFEAWNTLYYTNNGTMLADNAYSIIGGGGLGYGPGCGFQFDLQTTNVIPHTMAGAFYNAGTIRCNSQLDPVTIIYGPILQELGSLDEGQCFVSATNIVNSGVIEVSGNGLIQFTGQNVDLTRGTLDIENSPSINGIGAIGTDTNGDWDPSVDLGPASAKSSFSGFGNYVYAQPSTAYFQWPPEVDNGGSNIVYRAVFVQNTSPNVACNVYFHGAGVLGSGEANIEWIGTSVDPAACSPVISYLYLNNDYVLGASTNNQLVGGVPENFTFTPSSTQIPAGTLAAPGFYNVFPAGAISNAYAYVTAQFIPTSLSTNASGSNPSGALTNLPGRVQISAGRELNLAMAQISQPNYLSLICTNQFDGNAGAQVVSPYSDISLGVTNGFLTVTNLLPASIPVWSGAVQAWSTRWTDTFSNTVGTNSFLATNDFRVMIVVGSPLLSPTTQPQVQNLTLHATNSLVLCDALSILSSLFIDSQNLTLATNGCGNGASSLDGELNLMSTAILMPNSLPNVRNLTNNGAIRTFNQAQFGGPPAVAAAGTLSEVLANGNNVLPNNQVAIGTYKYTFVNTLTNTAANQVKIAATFDGSMSNLIAAINRAAGAGTNYSTNTAANTFVAAGGLASHGFTVTARTNGSAGNSIATTNSAATTNLTWNGWTTLFGGADPISGATLPYFNFINHGLISDQGTVIYTTNFLSSGTISNGAGPFTLQSQVAVLTNGSVTAGSDVFITSGSLETSNLWLQAGRALNLQVTNSITDDGVDNGNIWSVGAAAVGGSDSGFNLLLLPNTTNQCNLLGTTVVDIAPKNKSINNTWAGLDYGVSAIGFNTNNVAIGRLALDALANAPSSMLNFKGAGGAGVSNAMYVDELFLLDAATNFSGNLVSNLNISANLTIYYAQAMVNGVSVAEKLNGLNGGHLRWVPQYAGHFSSVTLTYGGSTITVNAALRNSPNIDSDGDGVKNAYDPTPFFVPTQMMLAWSWTNKPPPLTAMLQWRSLPGSTNYVQYTTNLHLGNWQTLTTLTKLSANSFVTNTVVLTNMVTYPNPSASRFYRVRMDQPSAQLYGPGN